MDTGALFEGFSRVYPPSIFEGFWNSLSRLVADNRLMVPELALEELRKLDPNLYKWVNSNKAMVIPASDTQLEIATRRSTNFPVLIENPAAQSPSNPWVVALAAEQGCGVVTEERRGSDSSPKIVQLSQSMGIECMRFLAIADTEGWSFP